MQGTWLGLRAAKMAFTPYKMLVLTLRPNPILDGFSRKST